jgi:hypothetical protein
LQKKFQAFIFFFSAMRIISWVIAASLAHRFRCATISLALFNAMVMLAMPHVSLSNIDAGGKTAFLPLLSFRIFEQQSKNAAASGSYIQVYQQEGTSGNFSIYFTMFHNNF